MNFVMKEGTSKDVSKLLQQIQPKFRQTESEANLSIDMIIFCGMSLIPFIRFESVFGVKESNIYNARSVNSSV